MYALHTESCLRLGVSFDITVPLSCLLEPISPRFAISLMHSDQTKAECLYGTLLLFCLRDRASVAFSLARKRTDDYAKRIRRFCDCKCTLKAKAHRLTPKALSHSRIVFATRRADTPSYAMFHSDQIKEVDKASFFVFFKGKQVPNRGEYDRFLLRDHHTAITPKCK